MYFHFYTKETSPFTFEATIFIMCDEDFSSICEEDTLDGILNSEYIRDLILCDSSWDELSEKIDMLFDYAIDGQFDWNQKTDEYYAHYALMFHYLYCHLETESGDIIKEYHCYFDEIFDFSDDALSMYIANFYSGNGEPEGAQLALNITERFMQSNQWHIGFYDSAYKLITDIRLWSKRNELDISSIKPILWFGQDNHPTKCWSITPETEDCFVKEFWGDFYEGALIHIFKADEMFYYAVGEYGLECAEDVFEKVKNCCPIDLSLPHQARTYTLFRLIKEEIDAMQ